MEAVGIIPKIQDKDHQRNTNTGLAIVKKILNISGGKITSDSQIGIGNTLLFTLSNQSDG
ncbi:hypothetical protein [Nostoc sp.]|uniref:hypothetical protein n=1 Tax=Nostoc sp. TaxID=1180 RepID=UPI002FF5D351